MSSFIIYLSWYHDDTSHFIDADVAQSKRGEVVDYLTVKQAADELHVGIETIRRLIRSGALRASSLETPPGRAGYRIKRANLEALLDARAHGGPPRKRDKSGPEP